METINVIVEHVVYNNEDNGYKVLNCSADGKIITAVGSFPNIMEGEGVKLTGDYIDNTRFGRQFKVEKIEFYKYRDKNMIISYLSSGIFEGIGEKTAAKIYDKFKEETFDIIEKKPHLLKGVSGISAHKAETISTTYRENTQSREAILFLQECGISVNFATKIYETYRQATISAVKDNPYILINDIDGIGFRKADEIAQNMGISKESEFRIIAGITHIFVDNAFSVGNTCLPYEKLIQQSIQLLGEEFKDKIDECVNLMVIRSILKIKFCNETQYISLYINYATELKIAQTLLRLNEKSRPLDLDAEDEIKKFEATNNISLHDNQKEAIKKSINNGITIITGGPGTGKTTIIKCILNVLKNRGLKVALSAPTGRASKRMSDATGDEAKTIHRMLGLTREGNSYTYKFNQNNKLDFDVIILDEVSMVDIYLMNALLSAVEEGVRLILVGDKDQLPSVSAGAILKDLLESKRFSAVYLTEIYRQSQESLIVYNAYLINKGEEPIYNNHSTDFFYEAKSGAEEVLDSVVTLLNGRIESFSKIGFRDIQILSNTKKGILGTENINKVVQSRVNPNGNEFRYGESIFREGDKVIHIKNNYDLEWLRYGDGVTEEGIGVFNGEIGHIIKVQEKGMIVRFDDDKEALYEGSNLEELQLAYAISVHKSQGSEFSAIIFVTNATFYRLNTRNILYTAITRARNLVVIVGNKSIVANMVKNNYLDERYTLLQYLLIEAAAKQKKDDPYTMLQHSQTEVVAEQKDVEINDETEFPSFI